MTVPDPFAPKPPADEAQAAPPANVAQGPWTAPAPVAPTPQPGAPVTFNDGKISVTFKGGIGFDSPWIVIYGESVREVLDQISGENAAALAELMTQVQRAGQHFSSLGSTAPAQAAAVAQQAAPQYQNSNAAPALQPGQPPQSVQAPSGAAPFCQHGPMQYRTGSKNGRTWQGHFCPTPKGTVGQCSPEFIKD